ncbi:MAG: hypothetical protein R8K48_07600 [Gallionella sp.]
MGKLTRDLFASLGIVDLLSIRPSDLALFMTGNSYAMTLRLLYLLRIFRVL